MSSPRSFHPARLLAGTAIIVAAALPLTGCTPLLDAITGSDSAAVERTPQPLPTATPSMEFDSQFTYDGSVSLTSDVSDGLEVRLDVWAAAPKRTREWMPEGEKTFGFAVNVYDHRVDDKAVLTQKRRVYISQVGITSQTAQTGGQVSTPFQFAADPRTLVPTDTLRSDRGLLLNSFQGGLHVPETTIHQLPPDTFGLTLQFQLSIWVEGSANDDTSFLQQTVYHQLPIAIFPVSEPGAGTDSGAGTEEPAS
ncbi:fructose 1,6-bisphosphatase [Microbacterium sp. zg.Y1090]|uniref:fructose 1,6-bisphosphatase n=1 Tax=Microbacterium TaxID=33882 RepID=UPI00214B9741|nr:MULTISPECIES: fructose 1,6-bisphosphatase [unclassified Microbacterium]MCR2814219.1 fructose 1,6-bisphosphatase [Microbacterium sp. zg.Y1084]MCR2820009.1 fructose 1,6-bisphosphatase [Microbacterium sp. zg.Y1090]MDL5488209.1 fructose 1,6-bisphosphatase [Microbacterium sp. zg-Y1211]WIM27976.1 fructose 1,6-bisphosphatase [Microbacterium sp. zg-Y1090]